MRQIELEDGVTCFEIGEAREPVVLIDNFCASPEHLQALADGAMFLQAPGHYPGLRAPAPATYLNERAQLLKDILTNVFHMTHGARLLECNFSIVTDAPANLTNIQRLPHFDSVDRGRLALLHYMRGSKHGGTVFYRHKSTRFETISAANYDIYTQALATDLSASGLPAPDYPSRSTDWFEEIFRIEAAPNRMAIYRGVSIHSGYIPVDFQFDPSPQTGRLTINTFLQSRE